MTPRYVHRRNKFLAKKLKGSERECEGCSCDLPANDDVFCDECSSHDGCISEDDCVCDGNAHTFREHARDLKVAWLAARNAGQNETAYRIEAAMSAIYPEWQGLVAP